MLASAARAAKSADAVDTSAPARRLVQALPCAAAIGYPGPAARDKRADFARLVAVRGSLTGPRCTEVPQGWCARKASGPTGHPTCGDNRNCARPGREGRPGARTERTRLHMAVVTMRQMLDAGVHFGHQTRRWNPKMKRFIFTERNGIYIIDLQQTLQYVDRAYEFIRETVAHGGTVLFIGTKRQAQEAIAEQATRVSMPYVNQRWLGGMLTNFQTVHKRLQRSRTSRPWRPPASSRAAPRRRCCC